MQKHFELNYLPLNISLIALEQAELPPFLGSTLRGAIGQALLQTDKEASTFLYKNGEESDTDKKQVIAKPYMIIPPESKWPQTIIGREEKLNFEFLLFGNATQYATSLILALENIQKIGLGAYRYPFCLYEIVNSYTQRIIWRKDIRYKTPRISTTAIPCFELKQVTGVIVKICTPLRIRHGGQMVRNITFEVLIRNITNRIRMLTERYGGWIDQTEVERLQILAAQVRTVREKLRIEKLERYSNRAKRKMDFSGLMGELEYEGNLTSFVPWLYAAQRLNIGRNTTFGMGKIKVYFM